MVLRSARLSARVWGATERGVFEQDNPVSVCEGGLTAMSADFVMTLKLNCVSQWNVLASSRQRELPPVIQTEPKVSLTTYSPKTSDGEAGVRASPPLPSLRSTDLRRTRRGMCCVHTHQCPAFSTNLSLRCAGTGRILLHHTEKPVKDKYATWTWDVKRTTSSWLFQKGRNGR